MKCRCNRSFFSNALGRIFEVDNEYDIDPRDPRVARFFDIPEAQPPLFEKPKAEKK